MNPTKIKVSIKAMQKQLQPNYHTSSKQFINTNTVIRSRKKIFQDQPQPPLPTFSNLQTQKLLQNKYQTYTPPKSNPFNINTIEHPKSKINNYHIKTQAPYSQNIDEISTNVIKKLQNRVNSLENGIKLINQKLDDRQSDQIKWRNEFEEAIIEKQIQINRKQSEWRNLLTQKIINTPKNDNTVHLSVQHKYVKDNTTNWQSTDLSSIQELQIARERRIKQLTRQNDILKQELLNDTIKYNIQYNKTNLTTQGYLNSPLSQQQLHNKLNSISELPKIGQDEDDADNKTLTELLSPLAIDPNNYT